MEKSRSGVGVGLAGVLKFRVRAIEGELWMGVLGFSRRILRWMVEFQ